MNDTEEDDDISEVTIAFSTLKFEAADTAARTSAHAVGWPTLDPPTQGPSTSPATHVLEYPAVDPARPGPSTSPFFHATQYLGVGSQTQWLSTSPSPAHCVGYPAVDPATQWPPTSASAHAMEHLAVGSRTPWPSTSSSIHAIEYPAVNPSPQGIWSDHSSHAMGYAYVDPATQWPPTNASAHAMEHLAVGSRAPWPSTSCSTHAMEYPAVNPTPQGTWSDPRGHAMGCPAVDPPTPGTSGAPPMQRHTMREHISQFEFAAGDHESESEPVMSHLPVNYWLLPRPPPEDGRGDAHVGQVETVRIRPRQRDVRPNVPRIPFICKKEIPATPKERMMDFMNQFLRSLENVPPEDINCPEKPYEDMYPFSLQKGRLPPAQELQQESLFPGLTGDNSEHEEAGPVLQNEEDDLPENVGEAEAIHQNGDDNLPEYVHEAVAVNENGVDDLPEHDDEAGAVYEDPVEGIPQPEENYNLIRCAFDTCHEVFPNIQLMQLHLLQHGAFHLCTACWRGFGAQVQLNLHSLLHMVNRPYQCSFDLCGRFFSLHSELGEHIRIAHFDHINPYVCPFFLCGERFGTRQALSEHLYFHAGTI